MSERVAFLGLGIMGARMAANVASAGFELTVWNRTTTKAEDFCERHQGVRLASTPSIDGPFQTLATAIPGTFNCWHGQSG